MGDAPVKRQNIQPEGLMDFRPRGLQQGVRVGNILWITGQVPMTSEGKLVGPGDFEAQAVQVHENIKTIVEAAGGTMADIVKIATYITDAAYRDPVQAVRRRYFKEPNLPASATLVAKMIVPDVLVEVEAVAVIGSGLER